MSTEYVESFPILTLEQVYGTIAFYLGRKSTATSRCWLSPPGRAACS